MKSRRGLKECRRRTASAQSMIRYLELRTTKDCVQSVDVLVVRKMMLGIVVTRKQRRGYF